MPDLRFVVRLPGSSAGWQQRLVQAREAIIVFCWTKEWHDIEALLPKHLGDGTVADGLLKRRRANRAWQYRRMSAAEEYAYRVERDL